LVLSVACAGATTHNQIELAIRFAIEVEAGVSGPVYVQLNEEDAQLAWVKAFRDGERVYFRERCEIEDCSNPGVICGLAPTMVKIIADRGQAGMIEFVWDGMTSVIDPANGCERREPAPPGVYTARFCYAGEAVLEGDGDPAVAVQGRLVDPICDMMPFELSDGQHVVFRIQSDVP
jgi:hypothetical protein